MKKIIFVALIPILFFMTGIRAKAITFESERYNDVAILKQMGELDQTNNGSRIYVEGTNEPAYCIEAFGQLTGRGTYYSYNGDYSKVWLDETRARRVSELVYFGYGYGNHTDRKWVLVTQMLVWRTVDGSGTFEWIDSLTNRNIIHPYDNEINELEELIRQNHIKPSFINNDKLLVTKNMELDDTNGVLKDYRVKSSTLVNAHIKGNKLVIERNSEVGDGEIVLEKVGNLSKTTDFYWNDTSQNTVVRGNFLPIEVKLNVSIIKGSITVKKIDEDLEVNASSGEGKINDAVFELINSDNDIVTEITLDENGIGKVENLDLGEYTIREKSSGKGYIKDDKEYKVEVTENNKDVEITISNKIIESKLIVYKYFGSKKDFDNGTMKVENGIVFELYNSKDELIGEFVTGEDGAFEITLPFGTYKLVQKTTSFNYQMVEDQIIEINETTPESITLKLNDIEIEVPNAGLSLSVTEEIADICLEYMNSLSL